MASKAAAITELSCSDVISGVRAREFSIAEYAEALLNHVAATQSLNAFRIVDAERIMDMARSADAAPPDNRGRLAGLFFGVKDSIDAAGSPTSAGTPTLLSAGAAARSAPGVAALEAEGAIVFAKTNLHELSFGFTGESAVGGAVRNPYNEDLAPGGSSAGNAAALAARSLPFAMGEDTLGSSRHASALCGVCGYRPTMGRYADGGFLKVSRAFDTLGPMARSIADIAFADSILKNETNTALKLDGLRIGLVEEQWAVLSPTIRAVSERALATLKDAGVVFVDVSMAHFEGALMDIVLPIVLDETPKELEAYIAARGLNLSVADVVEQSGADFQALYAAYLDERTRVMDTPTLAANARKLLPTHQSKTHDVLRAANVDFIMYPTVAVGAVPIGTNCDTTEVTIDGVTATYDDHYGRNTTPCSAAGLAGITLPAGLGDDGMPVGLSIDALPGHDTDLLALGAEVEEMLGPIPAPR